MNSFRLAAICSHRATSILLSLLILVLPFPARAVLGDTAASVLSDQARMKGTLRSVDNRTYVMHEITSPSGSAVREFVSPQGAVFGVAWEGQFAPDLQQLLGPYYRQAQLAAASQQDASKQPRPRRAPIAIETPGLVVYETGHPRSFHGQAYIPNWCHQASRPAISAEGESVVRRLGILLVVGSLMLMVACGSSSGGGNASTITSV